MLSLCLCCNFKNAAFDAGETSYTLQYTPLSDLSPKEVPRGKGVGRAPVRPPINVRRNPVSATTLPKTVDWRSKQISNVLF